MKVCKFVLQPVIILVCSFSLMNTACKSKSFAVICNHEETIELGKHYYEPLIEALEKYKTDNGNFPQKLSQLVPKYISPQLITDEDTFNSGNLPPEIGTRFEVPRPDINSYIIKFDFRGREGCYMFKSGECRYYGDTKNWNCE